jgi:hypothetical protein
MDPQVGTIIDALAAHAASSRDPSAFLTFVQQQQIGNPDYAFLDARHELHAHWLSRLERARHDRQPSPQVGQDTGHGLPPELPVRLIPEICAENVQWSAPYTPADADAIRRASAAVGPSPVELDEYLTLRMKCFYDDLSDYRPKRSYSDVCRGISAAKVRAEKKETELPVPAARVSDGSFRGSGTASKGLGFDRGVDGALESYRNMKKVSSGYGRK